MTVAPWLLLRYRRGGGSPRSTLAELEESGVDCSGLVLARAAAEGRLSPDAPDMTAATIASTWAPVARADVRPGDVACYFAEGAAGAHHVAEVVGVDALGTLMMLCASSGLGKVHVAAVHHHRAARVTFVRPPGLAHA